MNSSSIEEENQADSYLRDIQRLEQYELHIRLSLERTKADTFFSDC